MVRTSKWYVQTNSFLTGVTWNAYHINIELHFVFFLSERLI